MSDKDFAVGDRVTWNVYGPHTGKVVGIRDTDFVICGQVMFKKGDLLVLCDKPLYEGQTVTLSPDMTVRKI